MNFHAFNQKFSIKEYFSEAIRRAKYYFNGVGKIGKFFALMSIISIVGLMLATLGFIVYGIKSYVDTENVDGLIVAAIFAVIFITGLVLIIHATITQAKASLRMQKFASDNKLTFDPYPALRENQGFAFTLPFRRFARNGASGQIGKTNFWLFEYRFISGTGRHPYPNIFTVLLLQVNENLPSAVAVNKSGRLKIIWPRQKLTKVSIWPELESRIKVYSETENINSNIGGLFNQAKMQQLLEIYPKAEVQTWGHTLSIFIPGKLQPDSELAQKLFDYVEKL